MQTFIRVTEIWTPANSGNELVLNDGNYGPLAEFKRNSSKQTFAYGEGLPGKAWQTASPVVLKNIDNSCFLRTEIASEAGLTSAVAIPIFSGESLIAVLVFLCGDKKQPDGAIEVWRDDGLSGLSLDDGYYGDLQHFEWLSKRIKFPRGRGLPGIVWETGLPLLMSDLANSNSFLRSTGAAEENISTGVGLPFYSSKSTDDIDSVITFLSSNDTPIAKRFEVWNPDEHNQCLFFEAGIDHRSQVIEAASPLRSIKKGEGTIGGVWQSGVPALNSKSKSELTICSGNEPAKEFDSLLAFPIFQNTTLNSVVVFYN